MKKSKMNPGSVLLITVAVVGTILILLSFICNTGTKEETAMAEVKPQNVVTLSNGGTQTQLFIDPRREKRRHLHFLRPTSLQRSWRTER